jgi:adenylate cyclase
MSVEKGSHADERAWKSTIAAAVFRDAAQGAAGAMSDSPPHREGLVLRLLGEIEVENDGTALALPPSKKTRALLAYLAVVRRPQRRDRLCAMFWEIPDDPRGALRWSLSKLRALLDRPGEHVVADRETVAFVTGGISVDLFEVRRALASGIETATTERLVDLAESFRGEFLEGLDLPACHEFQAWCTAEREDARIARVRILDTLVGRLAEDPERALPYARTLVRIEVAEEAFRARLVSLLGRCGRRDEAQRHYDIGRRLLTKLGVPAAGVLEAAWHALTAPTAARPPDPAGDHGAEGIAEPGGICISEDAFRQVRGKIETEFRDSGEPALKNIARQVCVYRARPASAPASAIPAATTLPLPDKPSIAVLPFQNMSSDPEQEYFVDGMVEEIIAALSRIRWLFVLARNSSFTYKGQSVDVKQVGRELGVRYVLEGSVRKSGNRVRITGQLIDAATGAHLWADRFDGTLEDVFGLQDKVASSVVGVIEPALQVAETARSAGRSTNDLTAYDLYLRGYAMSLSSAKQIPEALCLMEQAIARDPRYGPALAWAALCRMRRVFDDRSDDREVDALKGAAFARRALEVAGNDPGILANAALALAYFGEDIGAMMALVDRALSLNPSFARGWYVSGVLRNWAGQPDIAIEHLELSLRLSPRARIGLSLLNIGYAHFFSRRFAEALPKLILAIQDDPSDPRGYRFLAGCYAHMGRLDDAREILKQLRAITPVVIPDASFLRNAEHRELFLSGLRLATGDAT